MSQLITLTTKTDGTFDNYFEDTITFPPNCEVAFVKGLGLNVAYDSKEFLLVPRVDLDDRDKTILRLCIDGVNIGIQWEEIYDAYSVLMSRAVPPGEGPIEEELFFSGEYRWFLDPTQPANIIKTICKAFNDKFLFYELRPNGSISYEINKQGQPIISRFGITSTYSTNKRLGKLQEDYIDPILNLRVFDGAATVGNDSITATADNTYVYSNTQLALNGGMVSFQLNSSDKKGFVGLKFSSTPGIQTGTGTNIELDYGIQINQDGPGTYRIIHNTNNKEGFNGFTPGGAVDTIFTFVLSRATGPETYIQQAEFTVYLLQGWDPLVEDPELEFDKYIIDHFPVAAGFMPTFCVCDAENGFELLDIHAIPSHRQDTEASSFATQVEEPGDFLIGPGGTGFRNTHTFVLSNLGSMSFEGRQDTREFFNRLGFNTWTESNTRNTLSTVLGNTLPTNLVISTQAPADIRYQNIIYLQNNPPNEIEFTDNIPEERKKILSETFPYLQFHIETLDAITYEGNFVKGSKSRQQNTAVKVLNSLPKQDIVQLTDFLVDDPSFFTNYDYEVFNPLYVALNNPTEIKLNQIKGRLVTPNNEIIALDTFENTPRAMIQLHVRKALATE